MSHRRIGAIFRKELREYRRNRSLLVAFAIFPLIFLIQPIVIVLIVPASTAVRFGRGHFLLYLLALPVLTPPMLAAYAVAGERQQAALEPVLTTPISREEFLLGKALAVLAPSIGVAYAVFALFLAFVVLFANHAIASAILRNEDVLAQVLFTPLLAAFSVWIGIAISTRTSDVRVAQQLSLLATVPMAGAASLVGFDVIHATLGLAVGSAALLLLADAMGWRVVAPMFDSERLLTGGG